MTPHSTRSLVFSSADNRSVEYLFIANPPGSTLTSSIKFLRVPSLDQIGVFENYIYSIDRAKNYLERTAPKRKLRTKIRTFTQPLGIK